MTRATKAWSQAYWDEQEKRYHLQCAARLQRKKLAWQKKAFETEKMKATSKTYTFRSLYILPDPGIKRYLLNLFLTSRNSKPKRNFWRRIRLSCRWGQMGAEERVLWFLTCSPTRPSGTRWTGCSFSKFLALGSAPFRISRRTASSWLTRYCRLAATWSAVLPL